MNEAMREVLVAGQGTLHQVKRSFFPELYAYYGSNPKRFLEAAWINAVMILKTSACVADVENLTLKLLGNQLKVDFRGLREKCCSNRPPYEIEVNRTLLLV